jgi:hypothetical protein
MVKCGKKGCKCSRGELHGPYYYYVTTDQTERTRRYIRRADVPETAQACENHRQLQAELRAGRARYAQLLHDARLLFEALI